VREATARVPRDRPPPAPHPRHHQHPHHPRYR
jgi:hypothetical protein